jgi:type I restriction enzyme S subunit
MPEGQPFIRIGNLQRGRITLDLTDVKHVRPPAGAEGERTRVKSGDLLVSITADIGMVGLVPDEGSPDMYVNQHIALARPTEGVDGRYVAWFLTSPEGQAQLQAMRRGATKAGLGLDDIRSLSVPVPANREQAEVVDEVERNTSVIDALQVETASALTVADTLRKAILSKAFVGRLVPKDPTDEASPVLPDRIGAASP